MNQKAVLVFADSIRLDLSRRGLPHVLRPLFDLRGVANGLPADIHLFGSGPASAAPGVIWHRQRGRTFGERLEKATEEIAALGYKAIVLVGRDCPSLKAGDVVRAFAELRTNRMVLGPDHRGGCYLIGLRANDRHLLSGIRWRRNTDCRQLEERAKGNVILLATKQDIDSWADVRFFARLGHSLSALADFFLQVLCAFASGRVDFFDLAAHCARVRGQMPPPALAG